MQEKQKNQPNNTSPETTLSREKKRLTKKATMALIAGIMVVVVLAAVGVAWYTRIINSYSVTFEVADYDLAVNQDRGEFKLNVYEYGELVHRKMAPGTIGWFPLDVSAEHSQTDVAYTVSIQNMMPEKVAKHFRVYYLTMAEKDPETGRYSYAAVYGDALPNVAEQWEKIMDPDVIGAEDAQLMDMGLLPAEVDTENGTLPKYHREYLDSSATTFRNTMPKGEKRIVCFYWEWYLDADRANADHGNDGFTFYHDIEEAGEWQYLTDDQKADARLLWDELDTDIGRYPEKYKESMQMFVHATGAQAAPSGGVRREEAHAITINSAMQHGTVTANVQTSVRDRSVFLTVVPDAGYRLKAGSLTVQDDGTGEILAMTQEENVYAFRMPDSPVTVTAEFESISG